MSFASLVPDLQHRIKEVRRPFNDWSISEGFKVYNYWEKHPPVPPSKRKIYGCSGYS